MKKRLREIIEGINREKAIKDEIDIHTIWEISEQLEIGYIDYFSSSYTSKNKEFKEVLERLECFYLKRQYINKSWSSENVFYLDKRFCCLSECDGDTYYYFVKEELENLIKFIRTIDELNEEKHKKLRYINERLDEKVEEYYRLDTGILSSEGFYNGEIVKIIPRYIHKKDIERDEEVIEDTRGEIKIVPTKEILLKYFS